MKPTGRGGAAAVGLLVQKYPQHEMRIHRLYRHDDEFRLQCDDHFTAFEAFEHWRAAGDAQKAEEYRQLVEELESLIVAALA